MLLDYLWRDKGIFPIQSIKLAVEHENQFNLSEFLESEIQHLLDIKAECKIAITYPQLGDENKLVREVKKLIQNYARKDSYEYYLLLLGFSTRKKGRLAIRFKGYLFDGNGKLMDTKDRTIFQRSTQQSS